MDNLEKFYIDGAWVHPAPDRRFPVLNLATEAQIGEITLGSTSDVDNAVAAAKRAFETYSQTSPETRRSLMQRMLEISRDRLEDLAQAMSAEMGAPITLAREVQADAAIGHLEGFIAAMKQQNLRERLENCDVLVREPIGVCGLITPWNWPINQIALKVIPALASGCTCVLKPSEHTPLSAMIYAEIIDAAGFPAGAFNLVHGDGETVGRAMSQHPDINMMSFTGSTRAGRSITRDAAETIKRVTLELGGKSPNLVFADADLEAKVTGAVQECMFNTGQSCDAPIRLIVERSCYDAVCEIAKATAEATVVSDPSQEGDHIGPLFDQIQYDRVQTMIQAGIDEGATLLAGGLGNPDGHDTGWFCRPTIFSDVRNDMRIAQEEIFGPVLVIIPFDSEEDCQ